ncbi:MAG: phosphatidylglycerophosphatase A [Bacteroidales bacterium]|nr:phosphatidylglycerophosphatase A [Bacteroidales bacterium]
MNRNKTRFYQIIATGFGTGFSPVAPGTAGALLAWLVWIGYAFFLSPIWCLAVTAVLVVAFTIVGVPASTACERLWGPDPSRVVVDEMVGTWIALLAVRYDSCWLLWSLAALIAFRVFDIFKPFGIRRMESLPEGWGIMADDILAGVYSACLLLLLQCLL